MTTTNNYQLNVVYRIEGGENGLKTLSFPVSKVELDYITGQHETDKTIQAATIGGAIISLVVDRIIYMEGLPLTEEAEATDASE